MDQIKANQDFMKSVFGHLPPGASDQSKGLPQPPLQQPYDPQSAMIQLPQPDPAILRSNDLYDCLKKRRSRRHWMEEPLTLPEVSYLLWATQGVQNVLGDGYATLRPVASGGARHPFETHLVVTNVIGLEPGIYRYLPLSHELVFQFCPHEMKEQLLNAVFGQKFVAEAPLVFLWSCIPYRGEWRYTTAAHKVMLMDAGHMCQNLYLACESIAAGTCAIGAYDQQAIDAFLKLDGTDQFVVYLAPVGRIR